eukprot:1457134-Amphidinium_carterae.1
MCKRLLLLTCPPVLVSPPQDLWAPTQGLPKAKDHKSLQSSKKFKGPVERACYTLTTSKLLPASRDIPSLMSVRAGNSGAWSMKSKSPSWRTCPADGGSKE